MNSLSSRQKWHNKVVEELIKQIQNFVDAQKSLQKDSEQQKLILEKELELIKAKRGIESLQEVVKIKDDIIEDLKDVIQSLKPTKPKEDKKQ